MNPETETIKQLHREKAFQEKLNIQLGRKCSDLRDAIKSAMFALSEIDSDYAYQILSEALEALEISEIKPNQLGKINESFSN